MIFFLLTYIYIYIWVSELGLNHLIMNKMALFESGTFENYKKKSKGIPIFFSMRTPLQCLSQYFSWVNRRKTNGESSNDIHFIGGRKLYLYLQFQNLRWDRDSSKPLRWTGLQRQEGRRVSSWGEVSGLASLRA